MLTIPLIIKRTIKRRIFHLGKAIKNLNCIAECVLLRRENGYCIAECVMQRRENGHVLLNVFC